MLPSGVYSRRYDSEVAMLRTKTQWVFLALGIALLFTIPLFANAYWLSWASGVLIVIVAVLGLHILTGLCGLVSMGQAAFVGVGAYTTAVLTSRYGVNPWLCLPIAGMVAGAVGLVFGLPCFRLKGFYLVVSTMAASSIIVWCFQHFVSMTGGPSGMGVKALKLGSIDFSNRSTFFCLAAVIMIVATFLAKNIQRTSTGRAFVAIRDSELAAEVNGISVFRYKLLAFFIGCVFAGVAGWLWAFYQLRVTPDQFRLLDSMWYLGMIAIGGWGATSGVFFGVLFLKILEVVLNDQISPALTNVFPDIALQLRISLSLVVNGLVIVLFMLFEKRGMVHLWEKIKIFYRLHPYSSWEA